MNKDQFLELQEETFKEIRLLTATKGNEYSNSEDQLANFKRAAARLGLTPFQILNVYLHKHLDAIDHYCATGESLSESMASRAHDAMLFLMLFKALVREEIDRDLPPAFDEGIKFKVYAKSTARPMTATELQQRGANSGFINEDAKLHNATELNPGMRWTELMAAKEAYNKEAEQYNATTAGPNYVKVFLKTTIGDV